MLIMAVAEIRRLRIENSFRERFKPNPRCRDAPSFAQEAATNRDFAVKGLSKKAWSRLQTSKLLA
jgi:hypothetical protein